MESLALASEHKQESLVESRQSIFACAGRRATSPKPVVTSQCRAGGWLRSRSILPTMIEVATETWTREQGGHGPLVLATGLWAVWRELKGKNIDLRPGKLSVGLPFFALALGIFVVARITGILEIEGFAMYGAVVSAAYIIFGGAVMRAIWFPLVYLAFALPPPDSVVALVTQPIKIAISTWAVSVLRLFGYPIASSGVTIQIGQYQLLVAAACAGLNSIVTLAALCLFYVYLNTVPTRSRSW